MRTYEKGDRVLITGLPGVFGIDPTLPATVHGPLINNRHRVQPDGSTHYIDCRPEWLTPIGQQ